MLITRGKELSKGDDNNRAVLLSYLWDSITSRPCTLQRAAGVALPTHSMAPIDGNVSPIMAQSITINLLYKGQ